MQVDKSVITKEYINSLPLYAFKGAIQIVETIPQLEDALSALSKEKTLGFDTETKPTFKKGETNPTALVQLSTLDNAYLFRLQSLGYSKLLFDFLGNEEIEKIGISIRDDIKDLKKLHPFNADNFIELNEIANKNGVNQMGVRRLSAYYLKKRISKSQQVSNWENEPLTDAQQTYAATDAWICLRIYNTMKKKSGLDKTNSIC